MSEPVRGWKVMDSDLLCRGYQFEVGDLAKRFWNRVKKGRGRSCWLWVGHRQGQGYGQMEYRGKTLTAHRLSYQINVGEIPSDYVIDHVCQNKSCVNPKHLEAVTHAENCRRRDSNKKWKKALGV